MLGMLAVLTLLPPTGMLLTLLPPAGMLSLLQPACLLLLPTLSSALPEIIKIGKTVSIDQYVLFYGQYLPQPQYCWDFQELRYENVLGLCY